LWSGDCTLAGAPGGEADARRTAFFHGTIGTEVMPLPVAQVLPDIYPQHFRPMGADRGDWIDQFGFIRRRDVAAAIPPALDPAADDLPLGFTVSSLAPGTGRPSPVKFVGIGCATCHTTVIRRSIDDKGTLVVGTGNPALNMFAWLDAFQAATLQAQPDPAAPTDPARAIPPLGVPRAELLTVAKVDEAYRKRFNKGLTDAEKQVVGGWLQGLAQQQSGAIPRFDQPFGYGRSLEPANVPTGPGRTQPFRTLVRNVLIRPGAAMWVYTKVAPVYQEDLLEWAQVDGGIRDIRIRSALAAMAAGASVEILANPAVAANIVAATDYTRNLAGPGYEEVFPDLAARLDRDAIHRGRISYAKHCAYCHGHPEPGAPGGWSRMGPRSRLGVIIPYEEIGTDPERVTFRYFEELPDEIFKKFPSDHPFAFRREDLRPGPLGTRKGYITKPLDSAFSRAPYLHNASVPTLAELINLRPRRAVYYRGPVAIYDPEAVGILSPDAPDEAHYFRYDATLRGNSNRGHDYPWPYKGPGWNERELRDLLEYLKTL
jgi:mono/diheme cytochrome c family protein